MKVKDLIKTLEKVDQEAYVNISTDRRFEEEIKRVNQYEIGNATGVLLSSWTRKERGRDVIPATSGTPLSPKDYCS